MTRRQVLVLIAVLVVAFNLRSGLTVVGPLVPTIREATGQNNTALGVVGALPVLAFGICSPFAPAIGRRIGLGRALAAAMGVLVAALLLRSSGGFAMLLVGTALMGAAIAVGNVLVPALVKRVFPTRAGAITSLYGALLVIGAGLAAAVAVPVAQRTSWQTSLVVWAAPATLACAAVVWALMADRRDSQADVSDQEAQVITRPPPGGLLRNPVAWQVTAFMGLQSALFYIVFNWWADIVLVKGVSEARAGVQLTIMSITGLIGISVFPAWTDRVRSQSWLAVSVGVIMAVGCALLLLSTPAATTPAAIIFGLGSGGALGLSLALFSLRTADELTASSLSGMAQTWGYLISAGGPVAIGAVSQATGGWTTPVVLVVVLSVATAVAGWSAGRDVTISL